MFGEPNTLLYLTTLRPEIILLFFKLIIFSKMIIKALANLKTGGGLKPPVTSALIGTSLDKPTITGRQIKSLPVPIVSRPEFYMVIFSIISLSEIYIYIYSPSTLSGKKPGKDITAVTF